MKSLLTIAGILLVLSPLVWAMWLVYSVGGLRELLVVFGTVGGFCLATLVGAALLSLAKGMP